jgi:dipeptidyl aminopeptidase/acylaminoacyl peptidase
MTRAPMAVLLLLAAGAAAAADLVPVKDFARKEQFGSAKISPKGEYLALTSPFEKQYKLDVLDVRNKKVLSTLRFNGQESVGGYWWVAPQRLVVSIVTHDGSIDRPFYTGELYAMNADGSNRAYLFGYRGGGSMTHLGGAKAQYAWGYMADTMRHDDQHILVSSVLWHNRDLVSVPIYKINVDSGDAKRVTAIPGYAPADVAVDDQGRFLFAFANDEQSRIHQYVFEPQTQAWVEVGADAPRPEQIEIEGVSGDGKSVYVVSDQGSATACLRRFDVAARKYETLSCPDRVDLSEVAWSMDRTTPVGVVYETGKPAVQFLDPAHPDAQLYQVLQNSFAGQQVRVTSATDDGNQVVLVAYSDRNPGDYFLFDRRTKKAEYIMSLRQWIDPAAMSPMRPVQYATRDGATIDGYLTVRSGLPESKLPLVVMPHGGPHGVRDRWAWDGWAQLLASRGYAVLQPNFRGSGGYGFGHQAAGFRKWGTLMQDDLTDAVRWAIGAGIADPARVCIFGASYGGYAALMSATREPDLYRCAASYAGVYDLEGQTEDSDTSRVLYGRNYLARVLGDDAAQLAGHSPVTHVGKIKAALLIAHGTEDQRVPFSQARILRRALDQAGKPYEWLEFPGEPHGFWKDEDHELFLNRLLAFLDANIGAGRTAPPPAQPAAASAPSAP